MLLAAPALSDMFAFRPLEEVADFAILAGAVGLVSGFGGRWFWVVPVAPNTGAWGGEKAWNFPAVGLGTPNTWDEIVTTAWALSGLPNSHFPAPDLKGNLQEWFAANLPGSGWDTGQDYVTTLNAANSSYAATWGPFGQHAAAWLLMLFGGGLAARAGLFGARWASGSR